MAKSAGDYKDELIDLPREERQEIVDFLIDSLERDDQVRSAWAKEARRRYDEIRAGRRRTIGNDEVFARLRRVSGEGDRVGRGGAGMRRKRPPNSTIHAVRAADRSLPGGGGTRSR